MRPARPDDLDPAAPGPSTLPLGGRSTVPAGSLPPLRAGLPSRLLSPEVVLEALPGTVGGVADVLGLGEDEVRVALCALVRDGRVVRDTSVGRDGRVVDGQRVVTVWRRR